MTKEEYRSMRKSYLQLPTKMLEKKLGELHDRRYYGYEIELEAEYRIASSVYIARTKTGGSLIYHLKNFLGSFVL